MPFAKTFDLVLYIEALLYRGLAQRSCSMEISRLGLAA